MTEFIAETSALLSRTPDLFRTLLVGPPEGWTETPDVAGGWRPRDVVGHLISGEETDCAPVRRPAALAVSLAVAV